MNTLVVYDSSSRITQHYGGDHHGVDIGYSSNEAHNLVFSNCSGTVVEVVNGMDNDPNATGVASWGNYVLIRHSNGYYSRYAHLLKDTIAVSVDDVVTNTQYLAMMGNSGHSFGRHLHFEVSTAYSSSTRINPEPYLIQTIDGSLPVPVPSDPPIPTPPTPSTIKANRKFNFVLFNRNRR